MRRRTLPEVINFMREIKDNCYDQILETYSKERHKPIKKRKLTCFVCDGFENYRNAFNRLFYRVVTLRFGVPIGSRR